MTPSFADFLTPQGIVIAAGLITSLVQLLKATFPPFDQKISGALAAFVISAVLYVLTAIAVGVSSFDFALLVFTSWLACATSAVGVYAAIIHAVSANRT